MCRMTETNYPGMIRWKSEIKEPGRYLVFESSKGVRYLHANVPAFDSNVEWLKPLYAIRINRKPFVWDGLTF